MDTLLRNTLHGQLILYECEEYSFYCNVPTVVYFDVSWEFSIQKACYRFREQLSKEWFYTHISLTRSSSAILSGVSWKPVVNFSSVIIVARSSW